jgi:GNAT superfamily N-acetyltransferase
LLRSELGAGLPRCTIASEVAVEGGDVVMAEPEPLHGGVADVPSQRLACPDDVDAIHELMKSSVLALFPAFYDGRQTASAAVHIAHPDVTLIEDGTYFVYEINGDIVACGGWSRRAKLYTGSDPGDSDARLLDPATEPARVRAMFVRGGWTRRGLGRAILEACEAAARDEGFRILALRATLPGVPLYAANGFVGREP